jgi:hypothetical protein
LVVNKLFIYLQCKTKTIIQMNKYKQNLRLDGNKVFSYNTHVATIEGTQLIQLGYWSPTTQKHINYVANELGLGLIKIQ